jgi:hypothetical protein
LPSRTISSPETLPTYRRHGRVPEIADDLAEPLATVVAVAEPTTFRLRVGCSASAWSAPDGSGLLTLAAPSVQTALDGSRPIVWMIIGMIKAHPTENRMARQADLDLPPSA